MIENHSNVTSSTSNEGRNIVREVRHALDMSLEKMADEMGCTLKTVWRCEDEKRLPKNKAVLKNFQKLAKKAGVSLERDALTAA